MLPFRQIKETCIYSHDLDRAEKYYEQVLGLPKIGKVEGRHVFFRAGGSVLLIFNPEATAVDPKLPAHNGEGRIHLAFEVTGDQYELTKAQLIQRGVKIIREETWHAGFKSFYFRDPDGHLLEVVEAGMWD